MPHYRGRTAIDANKQNMRSEEAQQEGDEGQSDAEEGNREKNMRKKKDRTKGRTWLQLDCLNMKP